MENTPQYPKPEVLKALEVLFGIEDEKDKGSEETLLIQKARELKATIDSLKPS